MMTFCTRVFGVLPLTFALVVTPTQAGILSDWEVSKYNNGLLDSNTQTYVMAEQAPAGIYFVRDGLDANQTYRLKVKGQNVSGRATLRIKKNAETPSYMRAPTYNFDYNLEGVNRLELLIYADAPFAYTLDHLTLEVCDNCVTNQELRELVLRETPELSRVLDDDQDYALSLLLDWASNRLDLGTDPVRVAANTSRAVSVPVAQTYQDILMKNDGGMWCAGKAVFFGKLLRLFGYESFTANFGIVEDGLNHVTTIVPLRVEDGWRFLNLDPTFNVTFWKTSDQMHDLLELLSQHKAAKVPNLYEKQGDISRMEHLVTHDRMNKDRCALPVSEHDGFWVCRNPQKNFQYTFSSEQSWGGLLPHHGLSRGTAGYFDLMLAGFFSVGSTGDSEARQAFLVGLRNLGVDVPE